MKIAMLSPISWRTPPQQYGPWEWVVSLLTERLVEQGIEISLFATGDSQTSANLRWVVPQPYSENLEIDPKVAECLHISLLFEQADDFDIIHNQFDFLPLTYSKLVKTPVLTTIHGFSSPKIVPVYQKYNHHCFYVAISKANRHPDLNYIDTIPHGIPIEDYPFQKKEGDYLLFLGRIHHDKGTYEAICLAKQVKIPLIIVGIIQDKDYFDKFIAKHIDNKSIIYMGSVGQSQKIEILAGARALLHLINFEEPFGLSVVEAMACGTPVIALNKGSMSEIIIDRKTGFLLNNLDEAASKISNLSIISRAKCREHVEKNFSVEMMVQRYIKVYQKIIAIRK